jgi:hypothetical protein
MLKAEYLRQHEAAQDCVLEKLKKNKIRVRAMHSIALGMSFLGDGLHKNKLTTITLIFRHRMASRYNHSAAYLL